MLKFNSRVPGLEWLSNFYPCVLVDKEGNDWGCVEKAYVAMKTMNPNERAMVLKCPDGKSARRLGKSVTLRPGWEEMKLDVMYRLVSTKFRQNPDLREKLLATREEELVEHAPWDRFWGDGGDGRGRNEMGKLLMRVREELR